MSNVSTSFRNRSWTAGYLASKYNAHVTLEAVVSCLHVSPPDPSKRTIKNDRNAQGTKGVVITQQQGKS